MEVLYPEQRAAAPFHRRLGACLVGLAAFLGAAGLVDRWAAPEFDALPNKLAEFDRVPGRYNLAFIGSSHVYQQIDPATFDAVCAERGLKIHSFNMGMPGWITPQLSYTERKVLESGQPVKYLVIDPEWVSLEISPLNVRVQQTITWHDSRMAAFIARLLVLEPGGWRNRLRLAELHALPTVYNLASFGRVQVPLKRWIDGLGDAPARAARLYGVGHAGDGYYNYDDMVGDAGKRPDAMLKDHDEMLSPGGRSRYEREVAAAGAIPPVTGGPGRETVAGLSELRSIAERRRVTPVFITGPITFTSWIEVQRAYDAGVIRTYWRFSDPARYPELYAVEHRFDPRHVNGEGAKIYSRLLAERFVESVKGGTATGGRDATR